MTEIYRHIMCVANQYLIHFERFICFSLTINTSSERIIRFGEEGAELIYSTTVKEGIALTTQTDQKVSEFQVMSFVASSILNKTDFMGKEQNKKITDHERKQHISQVYYESLKRSIC